MILVTLLVSVWALRLSVYILMRKKSEDYRYKKMREDWEKHGNCVYYLTSFIVVFMTQAMFSLITNSSALFVNIFSQDNDIEWTDYVGTIIWLIGFLIEVISD